MRAQTLVQWVHRHHPLQFGYQFGVEPERQPGLQPHQRGPVAQRGQPGDLVAQRLGVGEVGVRLAAPQCVRRGHQLAGPCRVATVERGTRFVHRAFRHIGIHLVGCGVQHVAGRAGLDDCRAVASGSGKHSPQVRHIGLQGGRRTGGRIALPDHVDQAVGGEHVVALGQQRCQHRALAQTAQRQ